MIEVRDNKHWIYMFNLKSLILVFVSEKSRVCVIGEPFRREEAYFSIESRVTTNTFYHLQSDYTKNK